MGRELKGRETRQEAIITVHDRLSPTLGAADKKIAEWRVQYGTISPRILCQYVQNNSEFAVSPITKLPPPDFLLSIQ